MDIKEYMNRIEDRYDNPYIQIPKKLMRQLYVDMNTEGQTMYMPYAYSFLIANAFLYKYVHYVDFENSEYINISDIKTLLKYNPNSQKINKISKRHDGVLEKYDYVETTTDIPVAIYWEEAKKKGDLNKRKIIRVSEASPEIDSILKSSILKTTHLCTYIPEFMMDYNKKDGTMNDYSGTYRLTYKEFSYFMFDDRFTIRDFLLYCFLKSSGGKEETATFSYDSVRTNTGISHVTAKKSYEKLKENNVIGIKDNPKKNHIYNNPKTYFVSEEFKNKHKIKKKKRSKKRKSLS